MTPLEYAIQDLGYTEHPKDSNKTKYGVWYGWNGVKWCMQAVQYWYDAAGQKLPYKTASCSGLLDWYKENRPECVTTEPQEGAIIIYNFGHTGIVESFTQETVTAIEGNTSATDKGSQSNGGGVFRRTRKRKQVTAYIVPGGDENMKTVKGSTGSEDKMIRAVQTATGAAADGEIGAQTMSDIACKLDADCFPLTLEIYKHPVIIAKNALPFATSTPVKSWANCISGSFSASGKPCSILVQDGVVRQQYACHSIPYGKPESVLYRLKNGTYGVKRVVNAKELPADVSWAVGGLGLLDDYDPAAEGFCKLTANGKTENFSDVLRDTNHTMIGVKNGFVYLCYCKSLTAAQVNAYAKQLGLELAVMLDGGHLAAINGEESFAKINTSTKQYYIVQGVKK